MEIRTIGGFCYGVSFAYTQVMHLTEKFPDKQITLIGELVHNDDVILKLKEKGVLTVNSIDDLFSLKTDKPILPVMRAHGSTVDEEKRMIQRYGKSGFIDLTCKFVRSGPQKAAQEFSDKGYKVVVFGKSDHPEARGIASRATDSIIYESADDVKSQDFTQGQHIGIVAQTTTDIDKFYLLVEKLKTMDLDVNVADTYCYATKSNQKGVKEIASWAELILVIGGKKSSNTQKLFDICQKYKKTAFKIENSSEINEIWFSGKPQKIGIAAGASTPLWVVNDVRKKIENFYK